MEFKIPDKSTKLIIDMIIKFKNPFQIPLNKVKLVNDLYNKYQCNKSNTTLDEKPILNVNY